MAGTIVPIIMAILAIFTIYNVLFELPRSIKSMEDRMFTIEKTLNEINTKLSNR